MSIDKNNYPNVVWGAVVYPGAKVYLKEYIDAIASQTDSTFKILVINDGLTAKDVLENFGRTKKEISVVNANEEGNPVSNRIQLLEEAKRMEADILIIGDCDDTFSTNRVEKVKSAMKDSPETAFFYNEIAGMNGEAIMPALPQITKTVEDISSYNYLGMSNTALVLKRLDLEFINSLKECKSLIFDWYLHSRILLEGLTGKKLDNVYTYYRTYDSNTVGIRTDTYENRCKEIEVKKAHYLLLKRYDTRFNDLLNRCEKIDCNRIKSAKSENDLHFWWDLINLED